jgi:hypothetical protein
MAKGMKDKFNGGEGVSASAEDDAPKGHGMRGGKGKRKKKGRNKKGRG